MRVTKQSKYGAQYGARLSPLAVVGRGPSRAEPSRLMSLTLHRHQEVVQSILILPVRLLIILLRILLDGSLHDLNRFL
jgi:hypothetical protein